jgi:hypothetical protein
MEDFDFKAKRCDECIHYDIMYCECTCDSQSQGYTIKNPDDGADCEFFEEDDRD